MVFYSLIAGAPRLFNIPLDTAIAQICAWGAYVAGTQRSEATLLLVYASARVARLAARLAPLKSPPGLTAPPLRAHTTLTCVLHYPTRIIRGGGGIRKEPGNSLKRAELRATWSHRSTEELRPGRFGPVVPTTQRSALGPGAVLAPDPILRGDAPDERRPALEQLLLLPFVRLLHLGCRIKAVTPRWWLVRVW